MSGCGAEAGCRRCRWLDQHRGVPVVPERLTQEDPVPPAVTVIPGRLVAVTQKPEACNTFAAAYFPVLQNLEVADFICSETLPFVQVGDSTFQRSFPGGIKNKTKQNPHRHWSNFTDCFLLNSRGVPGHWLAVCIIFYSPYDTSRFSKLFALTYQLFILHGAVLECRQFSFTRLSL